jgi:hypothetical protein
MFVVETNDHAFTSSCKATTSRLSGQNKGRYSDMDAAVLHFVKETSCKGNICHAVGYANKGKKNPVELSK